MRVNPEDLPEGYRKFEEYLGWNKDGTRVFVPWAYVPVIPLKGEEHPIDSLMKMILSLDIRGVKLWYGPGIIDWQGVCWYARYEGMEDEILDVHDWVNRAIKFGMVEWAKKKKYVELRVLGDEWEPIMGGSGRAIKHLINRVTSNRRKRLRMKGYSC